MYKKTQTNDVEFLKMTGAKGKFKKKKKETMLNWEKDFGIRGIK